MKPHHRLLIVDDSPGMRGLAEAFAKGLGYGATCAGSGEEAVEIFRRRQPDLVTLDLSMPGLDGLATLRQLRAIAPHVPVIMLSGVADTRAIALAVKHGAADFLRKPFEPQELEAAFTKAIQRREAFEGSEPMRERPLSADCAHAPGMLFSGQSRKMRLVEDMIDHVATPTSPC
jgi:DNA-binding response OmpR family regulator